MLARIMPAAEQDTHKNWAGNYTFSTDHLHVPATVEDVQKVVKTCESVRAVGTRHSFNGIADSTHNQISLKRLTDMELDRKARTVTVGAGVTYGRLAPYLDSNGFALHNLASLPHISAVGACSTGTHGSGGKNGNLATAASGLEIVTANGEIVRLSREKDGDKFRGAVVGLGALGVITKIKLDVQPTYQMRQFVYENLSFDQLEHHFDEIYASGYSVSLFTDWQNHRATQVWIKQRVGRSGTVEPKPEFFGATLAKQKLHPLAGHATEACTEQMGVVGPWYERLPHFKMNFTPSSGAELQSEYFVPRDRAYEAILAVEGLRDKVTPHLFITELRSIEADDLWMSMAYRRRSIAIHFTWKPEWPEVREVLPQIEAALAPFEARPHWGKLFTLQPARFGELYVKLPEYKALLEQYDSGGKFRNAFVEQNIFGHSSTS
jgi:xylitol oxidase